MPPQPSQVGERVMKVRGCETSSPRHPLTHSPSHPLGFTLIELITVMVVTAVLAAVAIPSLSSMSATRSSLAAKQILRDIGLARERAILTGTRTWVTFNTTTETYSVLMENSASPGRSGATVITDLGTGRPFTITLNTAEFSGIAIDSATFDGGTEIGFDWLGQPLNTAETPLAANGTVTVTGGHSVTVQIGTGMATFN